MQLFRVVISFMRDQCHHMHERGVYAMTPGRALDDALTTLNVRSYAVSDLKVWVQRPTSLDDFGRDAMTLAVIGSDMSLVDLWKRKHNV